MVAVTSVHIPLVIFSINCVSIEKILYRIHSLGDAVVAVVVDVLLCCV